MNPRIAPSLAALAIVLCPGALRAAPEPEALPAVDARVVVPDFGEFVIRLHRDQAPNAVAAFLSLAARDAFDGLYFHRTIPGFLVQIGDPNTKDEEPANDGTEAPPWRLTADAAPSAHRRGIVAIAARGGAPESAGMEWYVLLADAPGLDAQGTPFGEVIEGLDVVDKVSQVSTFRNRRPLKPVRVQDVRLEPARADAAAGGAVGGTTGGAAAGTAGGTTTETAKPETAKPDSAGSAPDEPGGS